MELEAHIWGICRNPKCKRIVVGRSRKPGYCPGCKEDKVFDPRGVGVVRGWYEYKGVVPKGYAVVNWEESVE